ncbi:hypothetical protein TNIN_202151 [Trichonephila inaurata madagascariensis]|uniref:Uncharacterized protein n=1 Tax=Trichonephila inaurata madagascariensis TaxID=2747483 RepID=A0A8X6ID45_9ARAC|nr:hypothetical protein TNIN_202151 [Trichonephila inaurata madagascariensis]
MHIVIFEYIKGGGYFLQFIFEFIGYQQSIVCRFLVRKEPRQSATMFPAQMKVVIAISFILMLILSAIPESTAMPHSREGNGNDIAEILAAGLIVKMLQEYL